MGALDRMMEMAGGTVGKGRLGSGDEGLFVIIVIGGHNDCSRIAKVVNN